MTERLSDIVTINHRFHRSVSLARDWSNKDVVESYLLTPTAKELSEKIASGVNREIGPRAWSITGPFGSGKSAFGVFLLDALCRQRPLTQTARETRKSSRLKGTLLPIIATGRRARLSTVLHQAIIEAVPAIEYEFPNPDSGQLDIALLIERAITISSDGEHNGIVLVIDEFGKLLEHASVNHEEDDLYLLQTLAELAARAPNSFVIITIQHQAFTDYLDTADPKRSNDWRKVQGRFEDETFYLPGEQFLHLIDAAIETTWSPSLASKYKTAIRTTLRSPSFTEVNKRNRELDMLFGCAPLHPMAALLLWPLFRSKLAQNERSLFSFLTSDEPGGFHDFLTRNLARKDGNVLYRLPDLYDFVMQSVGRTALTGDRSRYWAEAEHALNRLPVDSSQDERDVVKTITLLSLFGTEVGLRPTKEALTSALGSDENVKLAIETLLSRSIIIHRRHSDEYGIWQGSDFNLNSEFENKLVLVKGQSPAEKLASVVSPPPRLALRHYADQGTPRFFSVDLIDGQDVEAWINKSEPYRADGRICFVIVESERAHRKACEAAKRANSTDGFLKPALIAVPRPISGLASSAASFRAWGLVAEDPTLRNDGVARSEVMAALSLARSNVERLAGTVLGLPGYRFAPEESDWFFGGRKIKINDQRALAIQLSEILNETYSGSPKIFNELINRDSLTSAASKARRNLIEAMLVHRNEPRLGLVGFPPEASIYDSLLAHNFHTPNKTGKHQFGPPKSADWAQTWAAITRLLDDSTDAALPISQFYSELQKPPFGLRQGLLPILLAAAVIQRGNSVALYEDGVYVPNPGIELWERLLRRPEDVSLRVISDKTSSGRHLETIAKQLKPRLSDKDSAPLLMMVVMPLLSTVAKLTPYARHTRRISEAAIKVRMAASKAQDPHELLFVELPLILNVELTGKDQAELMGQRLTSALVELESAYDKLLEEITKTVLQGFCTPDGPSNVDSMQERARVLLPIATDPTIRALLAGMSGQRGAEWQVEVARVVNNGKPPEHWRDQDIPMFEARIDQLLREVLRLEEMALERGHSTGSTVVRIGLLGAQGQEIRQLIRSDESVTLRAGNLATELESFIRSSAHDEPREVALTALAMVLARMTEKEAQVD